MSYYWVELIPDHPLRTRMSQLLHLFRDGDDSPHLAYIQKTSDGKFYAHPLNTDERGTFDDLEDAKAWALAIVRFQVT